MKTIGFQTELSEDRNIKVGYCKEEDRYMMEFTSPLPYGETVESILSKQRAMTVSVEEERVMITRIKLSPEAFQEMFRLAFLVEDSRAMK
jgi:hypothetical protein